MMINRNVKAIPGIPFSVIYSTVLVSISQLHIVVSKVSNIRLEDRITED